MAGLKGIAQKNYWISFLSSKSAEIVKQCDESFPKYITNLCGCRRLIFILHRIRDTTYTAGRGASLPIIRTIVGNLEGTSFVEI